MTQYSVKNKIERIRNLGLSYDGNIEGGFLTENQAKELLKEIKSNYQPEQKPNSPSVWGGGQDFDDLRQSLFNFDNPLTEKTINGISIRITTGLIENFHSRVNRRKTYLIYANRKIIGKFYSTNDIKLVIDHIAKNLNIRISNIDKIKRAALVFREKNKIESDIFLKYETELLQEALNSLHKDINSRKPVKDYLNPYQLTYLKGIHLRVTDGIMEGNLTEDRKQPYYLYANRNIIAKFYSKDHIDKFVHQIKTQLNLKIVSTSPNTKLNNDKKLNGQSI